MDSAKRVINGTFGKIWVDGNLVAECYKAQAKYSHSKDDIALCGQMATDSKVTGTKGTGSIGVHKVYSRFADYCDAVLAGQDKRATIISELADPDAYGYEKVALYNVSFDDMTLLDWEAKNAGKVEIPFTFTRHEFMDKIEP